MECVVGRDSGKSSYGAFVKYYTADEIVVLLSMISLLFYNAFYTAFSSGIFTRNNFPHAIKKVALFPDVIL